MKNKLVSLRMLAIALLVSVGAVAGKAYMAGAQSSPSWGPKWTATGELELPKDFHTWVFLGSPLTPNALNGGEAPFPEYHNVYVRPEAFAAYRETGDWPEGTIMLKELQRTRPAAHPDGSSVEASGRGFFPGALNGIDISVKDSKRFQDTNGWGFFNFGHRPPPYPKTASAQPASACAGCHMAQATNMVFSKFYAPILEAK